MKIRVLGKYGLITLILGAGFFYVWERRPEDNDPVSNEKFTALVLHPMNRDPDIEPVWRPGFGPPNGIQHIEVRGSERFVRQVTSALELLKEKAPGAYAIAIEYVGRIQQAEHSGMRAYDDPPTFDLADKTAFYSLTWCASCLAHDSYHSKLYHDYKAGHARAPVPEAAWTAKAKERECLGYQAAVLSAIEAPQHELKYVMGLDGTHADINRDGRFTWEDHRLMDW